MSDQSRLDCLFSALSLHVFPLSPASPSTPHCHCSLTALLLGRSCPGAFFGGEANACQRARSQRKIKQRGLNARQANKGRRGAATAPPITHPRRRAVAQHTTRQTTCRLERERQRKRSASRETRQKKTPLLFRFSAKRTQKAAAGQADVDLVRGAPLRVHTLPAQQTLRSAFPIFPAPRTAIAWLSVCRPHKPPTRPHHLRQRRLLRVDARI